MTPLLALLALHMQPASARLNAFGLELMKARGAGGENMLFSPISASAAMSLLMDASAGATEAEIRRAMHMSDLPPGVANEQIGALLKSLTATPGQEVTIANAIFAPPETPLNDAFVRDVQANYGATIESLREPGAVAQVNNWASNATKHRINQLLDRVERGSAVLANAITFDGKWMTPFPASQTMPSTFHAVGGDQQVPTMHRTGSLVYRDLADHREVELPYRGDQFAMRIMLPNAGDPQSVLDRLSATPPPPAAAQTVDLTLPRFTFSADTDLRPALAKVGLGSIFAHVDLTRMSPSHAATRVSRVVQKAWIQVDESGTKAAAATAIGIAAAVMGRRRTIEFHVDHPFAFTIEDRKTGAILFAGVVRRVP